MALLCTYPVAEVSTRTAPAARALSRRDKLAILVGSCLTIALPVLSYATGSTLGAFRMFSRLTFYRLDVEVLTSDGGWQHFDLDRLSPHLRRDARRNILGGARRGVGEVHVELLTSGLPDIGKLVCELDAQAEQVRLTLRTQSADRAQRRVEEHVSCTRGGRL